MRLAVRDVQRSARVGQEAVGTRQLALEGRRLRPVAPGPCAEHRGDDAGRKVDAADRMLAPNSLPICWLKAVASSRLMSTSVSLCVLKV